MTENLVQTKDPQKIEDEQKLFGPLTVFKSKAEKKPIFQTETIKDLLFSEKNICE